MNRKRENYCAPTTGGEIGFPRATRALICLVTLRSGYCVFRRLSRGRVTARAVLYAVDKFFRGAPRNARPRASYLLRFTRFHRVGVLG